MPWYGWLLVGLVLGGAVGFWLRGMRPAPRKLLDPQSPPWFGGW